ncbi:uncharacterized protein VP01_1822g4, partial [Puccinia sorghi]
STHLFPNSLICDASTKRSKAILKLQSQCRLCLIGTPLQNHCSDLYTLLCIIHLDLWARDEVWQVYIKPSIHRKLPKRLKSNVLDLPPKIEEQVGIELVEPWQDDYLTKYEAFSNPF